MLRVTASFQVTAQEQSALVNWKSAFSGRCILEHAVTNACRSQIFDDLFILTDLPELPVNKLFFSVPVKKLPFWHVTEDMDFLAKNCRLLPPSLNLLDQAERLGDVHFFLSWRMPRIQWFTFEKMFHALLEDRLAARMVGTHPVDPNLFIQTDSTDGMNNFFPVWSDSGADRQRVPQLFRTQPIAAIHVRRQRASHPETAGFPLSLEESLVIRKPLDLELAAFYYNRQRT